MKKFGNFGKKLYFCGRNLKYYHDMQPIAINKVTSI